MYKYKFSVSFKIVLNNANIAPTFIRFRNFLKTLRRISKIANIKTIQTVIPCTVHF